MDSHSENLVQDPVNKNVQPDGDIDDREVREIIEIIVSTGKFWHHWDFLKAVLSYRLKQVLALYPESQKETATESQENSLSPETYPELVKGLDEVLQNFTEGPPFTLQRLCEILLNPKSTYPKLSKLALALEKSGMLLLMPPFVALSQNEIGAYGISLFERIHTPCQFQRNLLVTSTLSICTNPYPGSITRNLPEPTRVGEEIHEQANLAQNGGSGAEGVVDEEMVDAVTNDNNSNCDVNMQDTITETSETRALPIESKTEIGPAKEDTDK